jgi:hypothetical protein
MVVRVWMSIGLMCLLAFASLYLYNRMAELKQLQNPADRAEATATITRVTTPMVQKGQSRSEVETRVEYDFTRAGSDAKIHGAYSIAYPKELPSVGDAVQVTYLRVNPKIFVRNEELATLPNEMRWMQWGMVLFGVAAMVLPFVLLGFGRKG